MRRVVTILGLVSLICACEAPATETAPETTLAETAGFFDESGLLEGAVELDEAACVGTGPLEIRGQVATLIPEATSLKDEQVVSGIRVDLGSSSVDWDLQDTWLSTDTDALGRFCFRLPPDKDLGPNTLLKAATTPALRRLVLDARDVNIHLTSETLVQLLHQSGITPSKKLAPRLLNLTTISSTQLELLQPVQFEPETSVPTAMAMMLERLEPDVRVQAVLEAIKTGKAH